MSGYNEQFESQIKVYRKRQRLLVAKSIHFRAPCADFKAACRAKLSKPETVKFFWRDGQDSWMKNPGWAMLGFETRPDRKQAEDELKQFGFRGRDIKIQRASQHSVSISPIAHKGSYLYDCSVPLQTFLRSQRALRRLQLIPLSPLLHQLLLRPLLSQARLQTPAPPLQFVTTGLK